MGGEWQQWLNSVLQAGVVLWVGGCIVGLGVFVWNVFVLVVIARLALWLWDWLSLRETANWREWHQLNGTWSQEQEKLLGNVAQDQRRRWRTVLGLGYLLTTGTPLSMALFIVGQPAMGWVIVVVVVVLALVLAVSVIL